MARNLFGTTPLVDTEKESSSVIVPLDGQEGTLPGTLRPEEHEVACTLLKIAQGGRVTTTNSELGAPTSKSRDESPDPVSVEGETRQRIPVQKPTFEVPLSIDVTSSNDQLLIGNAEDEGVRKCEGTSGSATFPLLTPKSESARVKKTPRKARKVSLILLIMG